MVPEDPARYPAIMACAGFVFVLAMAGLEAKMGFVLEVAVFMFWISCLKLLQGRSFVEAFRNAMNM